MTARWFWPVVVALLAYLCVVQVRSALDESVTADEPLELAAGYSYLTTGDFRMNPEHPPLAKMLAALPLLALRPALPSDPGAWSKGDESGFAAQFFQANGRNEDAILFAARFPMILLAACLGLAIALYARAAFGPGAALLALTLYAFDPNVTAHGRYVKNDLPVALFAFLACIAWGAFLTAPGRRRLLWAGVATGLALGTKFSALFLIPVFVLLYAIRYWQDRKIVPLRRGILSLGAVLVLAGAVVFLLYAIPALAHGTRTGGVDAGVLHDLLDRSETGAAARQLRGVPQVHPYLAGFVTTLDHNTIGHPSYLLGKIAMKGRWYYFPVAFAVKTPAATLAFLALAAWACLRRLRRTRFRLISFSWYVLVVPLAVYGAFALASRIDIGVRHLLPIWPFLFILCGAASRLRRKTLAILVLGLMVESAAIYPNYLAFFNVFAGGPANGPKFLTDSNIDWGQDAKKLAAWQRAHPDLKLCVDYWGKANLARLGVSGPSVLARWESEGRMPTDCVAAFSVNNLYGPSPESGHFGWLRNFPPDDRIGYSIYIYDLAKRARLGPPANLAATAPAFDRIFHQDFRGAPTTADPAMPGEILIAYMTGLGPVDPDVPPGQRAPSDRLSSTVLPLFCQWDGKLRADVPFAGLAPGLADLYQVNVRVAPDVTSGQLTCGSALLFGGESKTASISIPVR